MRYYLPLAQAQVPQLMRPMIAGITYPVFLWAVTLATVIPFAVVIRASGPPRRRSAHWMAATVQAVVAVNVLSHLLAAAVLRGYTPGVVTAVLFNLPFSLYFFRHAAREGWFTHHALWTMFPVALLVHGPGLIGLFAVARLLARMSVS